MGEPEPPVNGRYPAAALVKVLKGHTVIDASCDAQGVDDVRLKAR